MPAPQSPVTVRICDCPRPDSSSQLIALLGRPQADYRERILITVALGESGTGPERSAAVRAQFSDAMTGLATATKSARPGWRDLACAAVIALARRDGPAATDVYLAAAASTSADVRDYGLMVLAAEGDERAWDPVLASASEILGSKRISYGRWYDMLHAVQCLARHAARGTDRAERLISLLRANWGMLARPPQKLVRRGPYVEPEMQTATRLEELWPGIQPDGPAGRRHRPAPATHANRMVAA